MGKKPGPQASGKTETILARVDPATRAMLRDAAEARGASLSREVEERLVRTLSHDGASRESARAETDALLGALRRSVERVEELTGAQWHEDGFTRDAVADAVHWLVRQLGPNGDYGQAPPPSAFPAFITDWTSTASTPFDFQTDEWDGEREEMRVKAAQVLIKQGVGKRCAEKTIREMAEPLPDDPRLRQEIEIGYRAERTDGAVLAGLLRVPSKGPDQ